MQFATWTPAVFLSAALIAAAIGSGIASDSGRDRDSAIQRQEPSDARRQLVEQGRYLAVAGDCVSCHTRDDSQPFAGGRALNTQFGVIYSANITADPKTGIGAWSEPQFERALRAGV